MRCNWSKLLFQAAMKSLMFFHITLWFWYIVYFLLLQQKSSLACFVIHFKAYLSVLFKLLMWFEGFIESSKCMKLLERCLLQNFKKVRKSQVWGAIWSIHETFQPTHKSGVSSSKKSYTARLWCIGSLLCIMIVFFRQI